MTRAWCGLAAAAGLMAQTARQPVLTSVFPTSSQPGRAVEVELRGEFLDRASHIAVESPDLTGEILSATYSRSHARFTLAPDAEPGPRYFRVVTPRGASNLLLFRVTKWASVVETNPGGDLRRANPVRSPALISGRLNADMIGRNFWGEEADLYRFRAKAGERIKFNLLGARNWTNADLSLALLRPDGRHFAMDEGALIWDPYIDYTFREAGDYIAAVSVTRTLTAQFSRYDWAYYQLAIGNAPQIWNVYPMGARRGEETEVELRADFVPDNPRLIFRSHGLDGSLARGAEPGVFRLKLRPAPDASLGLHQISLADDSGTLAPVSFLVGDLPEHREAEPNNSRDRAQPLAWPLTVNGRMDHKADQDWYRIEAKAGQALVFEIHGESYGGSRLDATLRLLDAAGKSLAFKDDGPASGRIVLRDPKIEHTFEKDGVYFLRLESIYRHWGPDQIYRLTVRPPKPGFEISMRTDRPTAARGGKTKLAVTLTRMEGFDCEVRLEVRGLPPGVTAAPAVIPAYETSGSIELAVAADAPLGLAPIEIIGRGRYGELELERSVDLPGNPRHGTGPGYVDYRPERVQLAIVEPTQFSLDSVLSTIYLVRGQTADVGVKVARRKGFDAPLELALENAPEGVIIEDVDVVDEGKQVRLRLRAADSARPIRMSELVIIASARQGDRAYTESAPKVALQLD